MKPRKPPNPRSGTPPRSTDVVAPEKPSLSPRRTDDMQSRSSSQSDRRKNSSAKAAAQGPRACDPLSPTFDALLDSSVTQEKTTTQSQTRSPGPSTATSNGTDEMTKAKDVKTESSGGGDFRETRTRKAKKSTPSTSLVHVTSLKAVDKRGYEVTVKLILANHPYLSEVGPAPSSPENFLGHDGNQYYCQVCRGFGDVVCCDGCPRVYHTECVPLHSLSREALDNDDDPWFCPKCVERSGSEARTSTKATSKSTKKSGVKARRSTRTNDKGDRNSSQRRCADCLESRPELTVAPCSGCGTYVHAPSCTEQAPLSRKLLCLNCRTIDEDKGIDESNESIASANLKDYPEYDVAAKHQAERLPASDMDDDDGDFEREATRLKRKKVSIFPTGDEAELERKLKKKKKKKRKRSMSGDMLEEDDEAARQQAIKDDPILKPRSSGTVQAIPAFCFYLAENRWKLERALSRKHRTFNRLPKGDERNALVAQEAAVWWTKLSTAEHQQYINLSMRDFEARIVLWKEEKNAREMGLFDDFGNTELSLGDNKVDASADRSLTYEMHDRLYLSTSVGSKPFKLEVDQSYNRVLLELLHDIRFHPLPMFGINRPDVEGVVDEHHSKGTIPFFEVHGPISTSIGDECLGCSRGWTHFCPVIQERTPAVEHRARLQSPLSSLMATRVGLGIRQRVSVSDDDTSSPVRAADDYGKDAMFLWRESDDYRELMNLPSATSASLFDPSDRADEMVLFIEETAAMKIQEPPRPTNPDDLKQKKLNARALPVQKQREPTMENEAGELLIFNKCGRCRTIIANDTGCVQCRRAQLVINKSKKVQSGSSKSNGDGKSLKVHATMLGRIQTKDGTIEGQLSCDTAVSEAMLNERWCPSAILPPKVMYTPTPKHHDVHTEGDVGSDDGEIKTEGSREATRDAVAYSSEHDMTNSPSEPRNDCAVDNAPSDVVPAKRSRSARSMSLAVKESVEPEPERQQLLKHYKKETSEMQKKATQIACYSILHALMRRDPLKIFEHYVPVEGCIPAFQNPMDLSKIQENVLKGKYASLNLFVTDANLLCDNALAHNPPTSIYFKTAKEMKGALAVMQSRAADWISVLKGAYTKHLQRKEAIKEGDMNGTEVVSDDPFEELKTTWPEGIRMLDGSEQLRRSIATDFMRTKENEIAYYGCLAIRRVAAAAEASLAPYPDSHGIFSVVSKRKHHEDEELRDHVDAKVAAVDNPQLKDVSTWREESVVRLVRKVQKLRLERKSTSENECSRCNGTLIINADKKAQAVYYDITNPARAKKKGDVVARVAPDRIGLATGLASANTCVRIAERSHDNPDSRYDLAGNTCVSVRGSKVHGMGVFADQPFNRGDVVAEYTGEYVVHPIAGKREKQYGEQRRQDFHFRLDDKWVIDATAKGGWARYINHSCNPNCKTSIIPGKEPSPHLRRVLIVAQQKIELNEEISYDYQFPLELDLRARIPCNCQAEICRGFMNWDLPEKGSNNRALLVQKRGANMRDRIRRLGRPLKRDEI